MTFLDNPSAELQIVIDIGVYSKEIANRAKMLNELDKFEFFDYFSTNKSFAKQWDELSKLFAKQWDDLSLVKMPKLYNLQQKMHKILKKFSHLSKFFDENSEPKLETVKKQIHMKNICLAMLRSANFEEHWLINGAQKEPLAILFGQKILDENRFERRKMRWAEMVYQIYIGIFSYIRRIF